MIYSNEQLHALQARFVQNNDWEYVRVLEEIAGYQIRARLTKTEATLPDRIIKEKAEEAALRLIEQYKKPGYLVRSDISGRLSFDVKAVMYGKKIRQVEAEVEISLEVGVKPFELSQDPILSLDSVDLYHLSGCQHYSQSVKAIAQVKGKAYCYQHAQELRYVFLMLRRGVEPNGKRKNLRHHRPRGYGRN